MSFANAVYEHLQSKTGITSLVSTRCYHVTAPTSATLPYIVYQKLGNNHNHHLTAAGGLTEVLLQIDCWASTPESADSVYDAVREGMDHFAGTMGTGDDATTVRRAILQNDLERYTPPSDDSQEGTHGISMTWSVWMQETVPTP